MLGRWVNCGLKTGLALGVGAIVFGMSGVCLGQIPSLTLIGAPQGRIHTLANAVSADGSTTVGFTQASGGVDRGFSWTRSSGINEWGALPSVPNYTLARAVTANGSAVFGERQPAPLTSPNDLEAFRYSNGVYQNLGTLPNFNRVAAYGASGDGQVAVGLIASNSLHQSGAMRWTPSGGVQNIGLPHATDPGGWFTGISRDGVTAFGQSASSAFGGFEPYTWTQAGGWRQLPVPAGTPSGRDAIPYGANFDGSIIVGTVNPFSEKASAVRWAAGGVSVLGSYGAEWDMGANAVSDDGTVIVGGGDNGRTNERIATIWLNNGGPINLQD